MKAITIKVKFEHQTKGGPVNPYIYTKNGKKEWTIKANTKTEFNLKLQKLRKKLKLNNWWSTISNNWKGFV